MSHNISELHTNLLTKMNANNEEYKTLLAKGEAYTQEDDTRINILKSEMVGQEEAIRREISRVNSLKSGASFDEFLNMPVTKFQHGVTGMTPAGEIVIDAGQQHDESQGLTLKQFKAMRSPTYKSAVNSYMRRGGVKDMMADGEYKTLQEGSDVGGGFAVPEEMYDKIIIKEPTPTRINGRVTQITSMTDSKTMVKVNYSADNLYTTGMRVTWTGEVPTSATQARVTDPTFGTIRIPVYTAMMSLPITRDLLEDVSFDLEGWIASKFRETIDLLYDNMILNGSGVGQPTGILLSPGTAPQPATVVSGAASTLTGDGVVSLGESLPEQYEDGAVYMFNKTNTGKALRLLKTGTGAYLFNNTESNVPGNLVAGRPKELNGYPYILSGFMPNVAANAFPIIFGDLRGYFKVNRIGFTIQVLNELYAESNYVVMLGRIRFGGLLAEDWKVLVQKVST